MTITNKCEDDHRRWRRSLWSWKKKARKTSGFPGSEPWPLPTIPVQRSNQLSQQTSVEMVCKSVLKWWIWNTLVLQKSGFELKETPPPPVNPAHCYQFCLYKKICFRLLSRSTPRMHSFLTVCFFVVQYEDISENDKRVKFLWKALENFTNGKLRLFFFVNVVSAMDVIGKSWFSGAEI